MIRLSRAAALLPLSIALIVSSCGRDAGGRAAAAGEAATRPKPRPRLPPYREERVTTGGRVTGAVLLEGDVPPPDSIVRPTGEAQQQCGQSLSVRTLDARGGRVGGVVVWLEGLRAGKPLPLVRRYVLEHNGCQLAPRAQAAAVGGTLNVVNDDRIPHVTQVTPVGSTTPIATLRLSLDGQVVPLDQALAEPGQLEIACMLHPWARASVHVFDHPYFATTGADGAFTLDSVPPGRYALVAWHERLGELRDSVTVPAGGEARVTLRGRAR